MTVVDIYPLKIDWARCMRELKAAGWTPYRVAIQLGADPPTAYDWAKGSEPRESYGTALRALHRAVCGEEYSEKLSKESLPR